MSNPIEIRNHIRWLNKIDPSVTDFEIIRKKFDALTAKFTTVVEMSSGGEFFFRVRKNLTHRPNTLSEIMAPPPAAVIGYERCNGPGVSMFYSASRRLTAMIECHVCPGDVVYLSQWIGKGRFPVNAAIHSLYPSEELSILTPTQILVQSYMETIFTRRVDRDFSDDYKITAALAQKLTTNFPAGPFNDIRDDRTVALRYPSIVDIESSYNTVLHAEFAIDRLEPLHLMELEILDVEDKRISYRVLDNAFAFPSGAISWLNDANQVPQLQSWDKGRLFITDGGPWRIPTCEEKPTEAHLAALLSEF